MADIAFRKSIVLFRNESKSCRWNQNKGLFRVLFSKKGSHSVYLPEDK